MKSVAIIPARGGSQRILKKNIRFFWHRPIITFSINKARETELFDRIIVSTDSDEVADIAKEAGADVYIRGNETSHDCVGTQEVTRECLMGWKEIYGEEFEYACCLYATAPLLDPRALITGANRVKQPMFDYVMSVGYPPLQDAAQFYFGKSEAFIERRPLIGGRTGMVHIPEERVCDINTPEDWILAEQKYLALCEKGI